jgi:hypothetical protein
MAKKKPAIAKPDSDSVAKSSDLSIDLTELEKEWAEQPNLFRMWQDKLAEAKRDLRELEDEQELIEAQTSQAIRDNPESYSLEKATVEAVKTALVLVDEVQEGKEKIRKQKFQIDLLVSMVEALKHRKSALQDEVSLWLGGYFADPKTRPGDTEKFREERDKKIAKRTQFRREENDE